MLDNARYQRCLLVQETTKMLELNLGEGVLQNIGKFQKLLDFLIKSLFFNKLKN